MPRRKLADRDVRKIIKLGYSYVVTLPIEIVDALNWREKQKVVVKKKGKSVVITDWRK